MKLLEKKNKMKQLITNNENMNIEISDLKAIIKVIINNYDNKLHELNKVSTILSQCKT